MRFRPCIDIHNGKVKQIVGGSLKDTANHAIDNFVSEKDAAWYAKLYKDAGLTGGHVIILNPQDSEYYTQDYIQAISALQAYPQGLMIGGGITAENAASFIEQGASHVIVTSYVFNNGHIDFERLELLKSIVGRKHLVLDLSCRKKNEQYYIVTNRWQTFTEHIVNHELLNTLKSYCDEFLIHAVDVEGKAAGVDLKLLEILGSWSGIPITYAGGVGKKDDVEKVALIGKNHIDITIGSALDLFGGPIPFDWAKKIH